MTLTVEKLRKAKRIEWAIEKFLKAIDYKGKALRMNALLAEKSLQYFLPFVKAYMQFTIDEINKAFAQKYINKSLNFEKDEAIDITTNLLDWRDLDNTGAKMLKPATLEIMANSGNLANKIAGIEGTFDIINPKTVEVVNGICSKLITQVNGNTREAINEIIRQGLLDGKSMGKIAKELKPLVGLTAKQYQAVQKYQDVLRIDKPGLSAEQMNKLVDRYTNKLHNYRADMIARTESMRAVNEGQRLAYLDEGYKTLIWSANAGACPQCAAENGHEYSIDQAEGMIPAHPDCLISGQVKIFTSKGWKQIRDIAINELVLTHKGRFKKVIEIHRNKKECSAVRILLKRMDLSVTDNHPILINGEWKVARDIKIGDNISYLASKCKRCGKLIPYYNKYCSFSCNSKDITSRQWSNPEHRLNMSQKAKAQMEKEYKSGTRDGFKITKKANEATRKLAKEGKFIFQQEWVREKGEKLNNLLHHRKASSERMKKNNPMCNPKAKEKMIESNKKVILEHPEKHPNYIMAQKGFSSSIEKKYKSILDNLDICYKQQYPIKQYFIDFAIPHLKIAVEVDGNYWHQDKKRDMIRQKNIEKEGWSVIRFNEEDINKNLEAVKEETERIICNHKGEYEFTSLKIENVKKWNLKNPRTLYNLSVEDDESYIANGFVVHNCRCTWLSESKKEKVPQEVGEGAGPGLDPLSLSDANLEQLQAEGKLNGMMFDQANKLESSAMTKERITKELAEKLKDNKDFMEYVQTHLPIRFEPIDMISDAQMVVENLIRDWAGTSGDESPYAIAMQMAAQKEFGLTNATLKHFGGSAFKEAEVLFQKSGKAFQAFLRAQYDLTQEYFAKNGITYLTGYRGMSFKKYEEQFLPFNFKRTVEVSTNKFQLQSMSSFSTDAEIATRFPGNSEYSMVIQSNVPTNRILSTCQTGYGCKDEAEFVVLGGKENFKIATWGKIEVYGNDLIDTFGEFAP